MKRVGQRSKVRGQTVVVAIWIVAAASVVGVYRLGRLRGEIAEMESRGRADLCVGRGYLRGEIAALCGRDVLVASEQGGAISSDATGTSRPRGQAAR